MKANFINSTSYYYAIKEIIGKINSRSVNLDERHLLIVPERYTLLAEKYLYENTCGSFDVEVLSPSRLFYRMQIDTPLLSREGAIMLIRGILPSIKLQCFYRSVSYRGFCEKLYDAINDFAANGVTPNDIPSSSPKLNDLKAIYTEYMNRINGSFVDSMGKLSLIAHYAKTSEYLNNVHIYVANFDYIDKATRDVLDALKNRALSYTECEVGGELRVDGKAQKYRGQGALAVKEVAKRLRYAAYNGVLYEDMAVITGNADSARVKRIFTEFGLPCFIAESKCLIDYSLSVFLLKLFECANKKDRASFIELSKNIYSGIDKESADKFENYVNSLLIDYKGFFVPFDDCVCENVRRRLISLIKPVNDRISGVCDAQSFALVIEDVFDFTEAERITGEAYESDAAIEKIRALCTLMEQVGIKGNFDFVSAVFAEGLKATKMSSIPYDGGIIVGDPALFRGGKYKLMAVLGFDDGFLPQIYDDSSLIGDDEKALFSNMERADQINSRYERELMAALSSAENIFVTYSEPSGMMEDLFGNSPECDDDDPLLNAGSKKHAVELLMNLIRLAENFGENNLPLINALYSATEVDDELLLQTRMGKVSEAKKIFFPNDSTSVSQLQSYFKCPFRHFADYGLRLKERDKGEISNLDIGSFMHLIVEQAVKSNDFSDVPALVEGVVEDIVRGGGKIALEANKEALEALKSEAIEALKILAGHLKKGNFSPIGQEIKFDTNLGGIKLSGKIDMADVCGDYIRLIDYKTGNYELKFSDVYYGKKIQLPLYMSALRDRYKPAAMFNFPFSYSWLDDRLSHRFSGFLLNSEEMINATDSVFSGESDVFALKQKSSGELSRCDYLLTEGEMESLINYAVNVSIKAVDEISEGYVVSSPCGESECNYCDYSCLCTQKKLRKAVAVKKVAFGEEV